MPLQAELDAIARELTAIERQHRGDVNPHAIDDQLRDLRARLAALRPLAANQNDLRDIEDVALDIDDTEIAAVGDRDELEKATPMPPPPIPGA